MFLNPVNAVIRLSQLIITLTCANPNSFLIFAVVVFPCGINSYIHLIVLISVFSVQATIKQL